MEENMLEAQKMQAQGMKQREIAAYFGVTVRTVRNWEKEKPRERKRPERKSKLDAFRPFIQALVHDDPDMNGELIMDRLKKSGYSGKKTIAKEYIKTVRDKENAMAVIRFETDPGHQSQVDWIEFGRQHVDGELKKLYAFVMVLGYSRKPFVRFTTDMKSPALLACHERAFSYFGGLTEEILYDNMKTAWYYDGDKWRTNRSLALFANEYGFIPRRCRVHRPQTKGKVERFNQYVEGNFFAEYDGKDIDLDALNGAVLEWISEKNRLKISGLGESRNERFEREKPCLLQVPENCSVEIRPLIRLMVNRESCITYETNRYSVPPEYIGCELDGRPGIFERTLSIYSGECLVRTIQLAAKGGHGKYIEECDRKKIWECWQKQNGRRHGAGVQHSAENRLMPPVDVRSPAVYELLLSEAAV